MTDPARSNLYRTVWRWHFFAGLVVLPVLAWMALTGAAYLYHSEIERLVYADWIELPTPVDARPVADVIAAVRRDTGGIVSQVAIPAAPTETWRVSLDTLAGPRTAFVRPSDGAVLGSVAGGGIAETIKHLHSLSVAGPVGNILVEIVAGWTIALTLTGFYLWWPRAGQRALSLAGRTTERRFWRNLHASVGAIVGLVLLFLAITGLPWSYFWGARFHAFVAAQGSGRPTPKNVGEDHRHDAPLPWSLRGQMPMAGHGHHDVGADAVLATARDHGLVPPLTLGLPHKPGAPYLAATTANRQPDAHVVYVDPFSGEVLLDARGRDFGIGAKAFEWGIYTHQGQQYGEPNRLVMLAACLGVLLLATSAPVMWWKRRRDDRLAAPPLPDWPGAGRGFVAIMLAVGALFPLTGATMLAALGFQRLRRALQG